MLVDLGLVEQPLKAVRVGEHPWRMVPRLP